MTCKKTYVYLSDSPLNHWATCQGSTVDFFKIKVWVVNVLRVHLSSDIIAVKEREIC